MHHYCVLTSQEDILGIAAPESRKGGSGKRMGRADEVQNTGFNCITAVSRGGPKPNRCQRMAHLTDSWSHYIYCMQGLEFVGICG
jgi:hypothetical protein